MLASTHGINCARSAVVVNETAVQHIFLYKPMTVISIYSLIAPLHVLLLGGFEDISIQAILQSYRKVSVFFRPTEVKDGL